MCDHGIIHLMPIYSASTKSLIAVVAQWIRPRTLNCDDPGSNLLAAAVVPLGKALYPHCPVPLKELKAVGPLVVAYL